MTDLYFERFVANAVVEKFNSLSKSPAGFV
jgi:hypothetical protein